MWWRKRHTPTDAAPQAPRPERLARVQTLAEQALALPSGGMRRWNTLAPLGEADLDDVAAVASAFLTGDDPPRAVLAGEMLDTAIARHGFRGSRPSADTTAALRLLLEPACHPDQPPDLIVAALSPLAMLEGTHPSLLQPLVSHPDPKVRAIALRLWANLLTDDDDAPPEHVLNATLDMLTDALDHDPAPQVRAEAAGALDMLHLEATQWPNHRGSGRIYERLAGFRHDPLPEVRAQVLSAALREHVSGAVDQLLTELADPDTHWQFVNCIQPGLPNPTDLRQALTRLQQTGWPDRSCDPDTYPEPDDRRQLLQQALTDCQP